MQASLGSDRVMSFPSDLPDGFNVAPVSHPCQRSLLFTCSTVNGKDLSSSLFKHLSIFYCPIQIGKDAHLTRNGNREMFM